MDNENTSADSATTICQELFALLPAYSLGNATPEEERLVQALLPFCPDAASALKDYQMITDNLIELVPATEAPPSSAALLQRIRASNSPPRQITAPVPPASAQTQRRQIMLLASAAAILVLTALNIYWISHVFQLQTRLDQVAPAVALDREQTHLLDLVSPEGKNAFAKVAWKSGSEIGSLYVSGLPPLAANKVYQVWIVKGEQQVSLGIFEVDATGTGTLLFQSPVMIENFDAMGISAEPAPGSPQPTGAMDVIGKI